MRAIHSTRVIVALVPGIVLAALAVDPAVAQTRPVGFEDRNVMTATRLEPGERIDLDGRLDEAIWQRTEPASDFTQVEPTNGAPATERTEVHIAYNENSL